MGQTPSFSQADYDRSALQIYEGISQFQSCIFPDVGIDESLLKYSGSDSNAVLQAFNKEMLNTVPGYARSLGSAIGGLTSVPNAVGIGALVISLIIEMIIKGGTQTSDKTDSLLRRVFGEEKASSVRDTMSEYVNRHEMYMKKDQRLREELRRLEQQLSNHLTILRKSLLQDGQMSSRGLKIWVNGAAFHVQMLIHEARLDIQAGKPASDCVDVIEAAIDVYLRHLDHLLKEYKTYKINSDVPKTGVTFFAHSADRTCHIVNYEIENCFSYVFSYPDPCDHPQVLTAFMDVVFSMYEPISGLKSYFSNIKNNLNSRIRERGSFTVPSAAG